VGDGWIDVLPMLPCAPPHENKVIVDASQMVSQMFYTFALEGVLSYQVVTAEAYPQNFDVIVEYLSSPAPVILGFSVVMLPAKMMKPRIADDRLLYFTTDFVDIGFHSADSHTLPSEAVDREMSIIWRWDLKKRENRTVRIYVDPTVPLRWRRWVKEGVEAWNEAFALLPTPGMVKAVLPDDDDWPEDYNMADVRFNSIYWSLSEDISSQGDAKVDPRTGEIIKADIRMGDGWVWAWLSELDLLAPNATREDKLALLGQGSTPKRSATPPKRKAQKLRRRPGTKIATWSARHARRPRKSKQEEKVSKVEDDSAQLPPPRGAASALLLSVGTRPLTAPQLEDLMGEGLRSVVMHEMGHILGLRHNFKGSTSVSQECLQNRSCTEIYGLSSSIMDYLPMNFPEPGRDPLSVHVFPPAIGEYDKLAIQYGYLEPPTELPEEAFMGLHTIIEGAKAFEVCYDADEGEEDPFCMTEDLSEDPVAFHEQRLARIVLTQRELHRRYVQADGPWRNYGKSISSLLREAEFVGRGLLPFVGGIRNSYAHRGLVWNESKAREPAPLQLQRRSLEALLKLLRPGTAGLLPPPEALPFAVIGQEDSVRSLDLVRLTEKFIKELLEQLLSTKRLLQVRKQELLLEQNASHGVLTVEEFLTRLTDGILGGFHLDLQKQDAAEMSLQLEFVRAMSALYLDKELPASLEAGLLVQLRQLRRDTRAAERRLRKAKVDGSNLKAWPTLLEVHVSVLNGELASALCGKGAEECQAKSASVRGWSTKMLLLAFLSFSGCLW